MQALLYSSSVPVAGMQALLSITSVPADLTLSDKALYAVTLSDQTFFVATVGDDINI
jgi:hypothetical protein